MRVFPYLLMIFFVSACNLTTPGSPADIASPTIPATQLTPNVPASPMPTDRVTYINTEQGYTLQHPGTLAVVEGSDSRYVLIGDQIDIMVSDSNPDEAQGDRPTGATNTQDVMVGPYPAQRKQGQTYSIAGGTPQGVEWVLIEHNERFYTITVYELKRSAWTGELRTPGAIPAEAMSLFDEILSTFRFTDSQ